MEKDRMKQTYLLQVYEKDLSLLLKENFTLVKLNNLD